MVIGKVERFSEREYPGKRAAVLYAQGCNLRCPYCSYAEYLGECRSSGGLLRERIFSFLEGKRDRINGVVFSGGEPTLQEGLLEWMQAVKNLGYAVKLDTNGTQPEVIRELINAGVVDYIAMDVKAPLENYASLAGCRCDPEAIRMSIWIIKQSEVNHEFRTTVVPGLHTLRELKAITELLHGAQKYVVQDFVSKSPLRSDLRGRPAFPPKPLEDLRSYALRRVKEYEIRNYEDARKMPVSTRRRRKSSNLATVSQ